VAELVAADAQFHAAIASASGNPVLASLIDNLSGSTQRAPVWRDTPAQQQCR
jgi:DNA-binding FadR family transcriptional regulator